MHPLIALLIIAVAAWLLATFVSGTLAAIVVLIGVIYVVAVVIRSADHRW